MGVFDQFREGFSRTFASGKGARASEGEFGDAARDEGSKGDRVGETDLEHSNGDNTGQDRGARRGWRHQDAKE